MITLTFTYQEAQTLLNLIGNNVVWSQANPFLMKIGDAMRQQAPGNSGQIPATVPTNDADKLQ
jgi:hypothetical protein